MKLVILAVRDRAADAFANPFYAPTIGAAVRGFSDEMNKSDSRLRLHPEDYDLFELGTFDDNSGVFNCHAPRQVAVGKDLVTKE